MTLQRATIHVSEAGLRRDRTIAPGLPKSAMASESNFFSESLLDFARPNH